ncbi:MAG: hypothetical protein LIP08_01630 [Bacteroides sp.]|nr:hypothetical protein [Bacteroides sp.]
MKKIYTILSLMIVAVTISFSSCTPDSYDLGAEGVSPGDLVEGIAFTVTHDTENPNIVYLKSLMGSQYTPVWIHPQGYSEAEEVTLKMPFDGTYDVVFGVQTRGEIVYGDTVQFTIAEFYPDFVSDDLWTYLTGGVGHSKTWIFDNGNYGLASGELSFQDPGDGAPTMSNFSPNWEPGAGHTGDDNIWDSYMTFTLDGGAFVEVHNAGWKDESGTFMLNVDDGTLSLVDASIPHPESWDANSSNWRNNLNVVALTENQLRIAVFRDTSSEGEWWYVWNFVSKEYADNYVPSDDPILDIDGDPNDILSTSNTKSWVLSLDSPYDWMTLEGDLMNEFATADDYNNGWVAYEEDKLENVQLVFTGTGVNTGTYILTDSEGNEVEGDYTIDSKNDIKFSEGFDFVISRHQYDGWESVMSMSTTSDNKLRIVKTVTNAVGTVTEMYLGKRDEEGANQYMVYHFVLGGNSAGGDADFEKEFFKAICGSDSRTYKIDTSWPIDWLVNSSHSLSGGWISPGSEEGWYWDDEIKANASKGRITFYNSTGTSCSVKLVDYDGTEATGTCTVDIDAMLVTIPTGIPRIGNWLDSEAEKTEFYVVNSNITDIKSGDFWLGPEEERYDDNGSFQDFQITAFHLIVE